jgi:sugar phosphate isomerase/epimerase
MHLSTHNWMRAEPLEVTLKRIKRLGFESIEISGEPAQYKTKASRPLLEQHGIRCWGAVTLTLGERNLAAKDEAQRAKSVDYVKSVVTMVKELDGTEITIVPATVGKIVPDGTPQDEWRWVVDGLREVYDHAEECGVRMAIEPLNRFETYFVNRGEQALALAKDVGPNCGVCLDVFHMNIEEVDLFATIKKIGKKLYDVHVAENNRLAPGMGRIDGPRLVSTLREVGYDGALTMEAVAPVDRTPVSPWPNQVEKNPVDISPEQLKFIQDHGSSLLSEEFYTMLYETASRTLLPLIR